MDFFCIKQLWRFESFSIFFKFTGMMRLRFCGNKNATRNILSARWRRNKSNAFVLSESTWIWKFRSWPSIANWKHFLQKYLLRTLLRCWAGGCWCAGSVTGDFTVQLAILLLQTINNLMWIYLFLGTETQKRIRNIHLTFGCCCCAHRVQCIGFSKERI